MKMKHREFVFLFACLASCRGSGGSTAAMDESADSSGGSGGDQGTSAEGGSGSAGNRAGSGGNDTGPGGAGGSKVASLDAGAGGSSAGMGGTANAGGSPVVVDAGSTPSDAGVAAPWLIKSGDSVFFVGNSFFGWQNRVLPDWVAAVGKALKPPITINTGSQIVFGNMPLSWFLTQAESQNAIKSKKYKVFVLQGEEREPVENKAAFHKAVRDYNTAVKANGGTVMLFMTWDFSWEKGSTFFKLLSASYDEIGKELNIPVIPVGLIYDDANKTPFGNEKAYWLTGQDLHPVASGAAVNAYATFSMLTGVDPMGKAFVANGNTSSPELLQYLSTRSWARTSVRLKSSAP